MDCYAVWYFGPKTVFLSKIALKIVDFKTYKQITDNTMNHGTFNKSKTIWVVRLRLYLYEFFEIMNRL